MGNAPLVSVLIPAYNAHRFIGRALASVQRQTYPNVEILVVDDGSDDETADLVRDLAADDPRIELYQTANQGVAAARNRALAEAKGPYVAPLDADDVWFPRKLEWQVARMQETGPSTGLVYSWWAGLDEDGTITGAAGRHSLEGDVYDALAYRNFIGNASVPLLRRACAEEVGGYDPSLKARGGEGCEDWDLTLRIAKKYDVCLVPAYLSGYRSVSDSMSDSTASMARSFSLVMERVEQSSRDVPPRFLRWARANFYRYLAAQSYNAGHFETTLHWLRASVHQDSTAMFSSWILKTAIKSAVRRLAAPVTALVWENHRDWLTFKGHFVLKLSDPPSIDQLQYRPESVAESWGPRWWKPHDLIRAYRWRRAKERCGV